MENHPYQITASSNQIAIKWQHQDGSFDNYIIQYREINGKDKTYRLMETLENEIKITNLKSNTSYEIRLFIQRDGEDKLFFKQSTETSTSIASQFTATSEKIKDNPPVYQLRPVRVESLGDEINLNHMIADTGDVDKDNIKTILFVGASESGKSTLLDALINFILKVPHADEFRFKMIDDIADQKAKAKHLVISKTQYTTCYKIPQNSGFEIEFPLQVIDTPGLQDRSASQNNKEITKQLLTLFVSDKITHINAVCIVLPSSCRLTQEQQDVFKEILLLFGNDINCLIPIVTFDDGGSLNASSALSEAGIPFMDHMLFRFNNAMLFSENESEDAWNNRNESFKNLLASISVNSKQSVKLTEEVLKQRAGIHSDLKLMKRSKKEIERMLKNISQSENEVNYHERIRAENENYQFKENELLEIRRESTNGVYINCPNCKLKCRTIRDTSRSSCSSIFRSLWWCIIQMCSILCIVCCVRDCHWLKCNHCSCMLGHHEKESALYRRIYQSVNKIQTAKKLQFDSAIEAKEKIQKKIQTLKTELITLLSQFEGLVHRNRKRMENLNCIALKSEQYNDLQEMSDALEKFERSVARTHIL